MSGDANGRQGGGNGHKMESSLPGQVKTGTLVCKRLPEKGPEFLCSAIPSRHTNNHSN